MALRAALAIAAFIPASGSVLAADAAAVNLDQLGEVRAPAAADQVSIPAAEDPVDAFQVAPSISAQRAVTITPVTPPQPRAGAVNVAQPQGEVDLCERIAAGRSPPVQGLDCSGTAVEPRAGGPAVDGPTSAVDVNSLDSTIDAIGRRPDATVPDGSVPSIVILGPR
jgi:hypothetical protein